MIYSPLIARYSTTTPPGVNSPSPASPTSPASAQVGQHVDRALGCLARRGPARRVCRGPSRGFRRRGERGKKEGNDGALVSVWGVEAVEGGVFWNGDEVVLVLQFLAQHAVAGSDHLVPLGIVFICFYIINQVDL